MVLISFEDDFGETQKIASQGTQTRFAGNPLKMTDAESLPRNMTDLRPCSLCALCLSTLSLFSKRVAKSAILLYQVALREFLFLCIFIGLI